MKRRIISLSFAVLAALVLRAAPAPAAESGGPMEKARLRIEQKAARANKICDDRRLAPKTRSRQICSRYGICNINVPCGQAVRQWQDRALANLKNSPAAKPGPAAPPPVALPVEPPPVEEER